MPHSARTKAFAAAPLTWLLPALLLLSFVPLFAGAAVGDACNQATPQTCGTGYMCNSTNGAAATCQLDWCSGSCNYSTQACNPVTKECVAKPAVNGGVGSNSTSAGPGTQSSGGSAGTNSTSAGPGSGKQVLVNPLKGVNSLEDLITALLDAIVQLGSIILILALVWVGAQFVFARGNEEQLRTARGALMWTIIGGLVLLGSKAISMVIQSTADALK